MRPFVTTREFFLRSCCARLRPITSSPSFRGRGLTMSVVLQTKAAEEVARAQGRAPRSPLNHEVLAR